MSETANANVNEYGTQEIEDGVVLKARKRWGFFGLPFTFTTYTMYSRKLTLKTGFFSTREDDMLLYRVMDLSLRRTLGQKLFGLATIVVTSTDKSTPELVIKNINNFRVFKNELEDRVEKERTRKQMRTSEMLGVDLDADNAAEGIIN